MDKKSKVISSPIVLLGGQGPVTAHLAGANGFPPQVYAPLVAALAEGLTVQALLPLAIRSPTLPPRRLCWVELAEEMAQRLLDAGVPPLVGIGHSLGATLTLIAAARHPGLFRALVLLDPVLFPYRHLALFALLRLLGLHFRFPLAARARRRRATFPSHQAAADHYRTRPLFRRWHPDAFAAYIAHGLVPDASGGVRLAYPPAWEAAIFANPPFKAWRWARRVNLPTLVVYGEHTNTFLPAARRRLQRLWPHATFMALPHAGHLFPLEQPQQSARQITAWLREQGFLHSMRKAE